MLEHVVESDPTQGHGHHGQIEGRSLSERYLRQLHRLERVIHISDRYQSMLKDLNDSLHEAATHDQLTGIPNRRLMADRCRDEDERALRHGDGYCMAVFDADYFKQVNDTYGHDVGDKVLVELANILRRSMREYDLCARWGGEEFLALFVGVDFPTGLDIVERILQKVRDMVIPVDGKELRITVSAGWRSTSPPKPTWIPSPAPMRPSTRPSRRGGTAACSVPSPSSEVGFLVAAAAS